ncbi:MAG: hypothetical protein ACO3QP_02270 [Burkholderiaceae bacterium]
MKRMQSILLLWGVLLIGLVLDFVANDRPRPEPPAVILGSGQASSGGHCSGR